MASLTGYQSMRDDGAHVCMSLTWLPLEIDRSIISGSGITSSVWSNIVFPPETIHACA